MLRALCSMLLQAITSSVSLSKKYAQSILATKGAFSPIFNGTWGAIRATSVVAPTLK